MSAELDRLTASVTKITTVAASAEALLSQLSGIIRDNANNPAALTALADELDSDASGISEAITANTPAEG